MIDQINNIFYSVSKSHIHFANCELRFVDVLRMKYQSYVSAKIYKKKGNVTGRNIKKICQETVPQNDQ